MKIDTLSFGLQT